MFLVLVWMIRKRSKFDSSSHETNNLVVTSIDIQSVEPGDQCTRDALQKSVQLAIEITSLSGGSWQVCGGGVAGVLG